MLRTVDLSPTDSELIERLVSLSVRAAAMNAPAWLPTPEHARNELVQVASKAAICRALLEDDMPRGWVGAAPCTDTAWELHPLLVDPNRHGGGFGARLVAEVERAAVAAGALTMVVSTSDAAAVTTLGGIDLFTEPLGALQRLAVRDPHASHAFRFWQRVGYTVVGVLPDAEGPGVPNILLAKSLRPENAARGE